MLCMLNEIFCHHIYAINFFFLNLNQHLKSTDLHKIYIQRVKGKKKRKGATMHTLSTDDDVSKQTTSYIALVDDRKLHFSTWYKWEKCSQYSSSMEVFEFMWDAPDGRGWSTKILNFLNKLANFKSFNLTLKF